MSKFKKVLNLFLCITLIVTFSKCTCEQTEFNWNGIRPEVRADVELFEGFERIATNYISRGGETPNEWYLKSAIMQNATEKELISLTDYPVSSIRAVALDALLKRPNTDHYKWIMKALNDTTGFFEFQVGCISDVQMVGEYIIQSNSIVKIDSLFLPPPPIQSKKIFFSKEQLESIKVLYKEMLARKWEYYYDFYKDEMVEFELE
ncbi:hypothetical protein [Chondrinema litorale]|uniref:hypothetical protein n=1 Tax=Chondrinema litorale TaxID=2994555 RepID=UPI002542AE2D|nr:hypothetical protein [Chondrinema litorale]UZR93817.1 hypothetical protein OQ292_18380 [Chondrinema litorale]